MLDVERRVDAEVARRLAVGEAVVAHEPVELRPRDRGLGGLDRIEHGEPFRAGGRPRRGARRRLRKRCARGISTQRAREPIPERDVGLFLGRVLGIRRAAGGLGERDDEVAVLARVERELLPAQLAAAPARVERVAEDVPALPRVLHTIEETHCCLLPRCRRRCYRAVRLRYASSTSAMWKASSSRGGSSDSRNHWSSETSSAAWASTSPPATSAVQ